MLHPEALHVRINREFRSHSGKCSDTPGQIPTSEGSHPHPRRLGSWGSPPSRPCTRPSEQGPGIPIPPERTLWPHPGRSTVPEMKTHFTKGPWGELLLSNKMRRGERGKDELSWSNILTDPSKAIWRKLQVSNFNSLCFYPEIMITSNQCGGWLMFNVEVNQCPFLWTLHEIQLNKIQ